MFCIHTSVKDEWTVIANGNVPIMLDSVTALKDFLYLKKMFLVCSFLTDMDYLNETSSIY